MNASPHQSGQQNEEISLKGLILTFQNWRGYLFSKWKIIVLSGLLGAGLGFAYAYTQKVKYVAEMTFVLEDSKSGQLSSYAGLASQFGIDLGGGSGSGVFTGDNILEFLRSRLMVEKTLLSPVGIGGKNTSLADYYLQVNKYNEKWAKSPELKKISFPANINRSSFSLLQDSVLNILYMDIIKNNLSIAKPDKKLSFIAVKCNSTDEKFSKIFVERLVREATDFYVQTKTKRSKINVDLLQLKADSIERLLNQKTYSVAASQDLNLNPARNVARVGTQLAARDQQVLLTMYSEVVKNLELSRMAMSQETPIIQIVDTPILPLRKERVGKLKGLILGGFIAGFLIVLVLLVRKLYREIMT
ncbi:lipopolysaccharide biosynthesis protein [Chitinophaga niabensis]|uniref:lipopolysaccharide biosynthesis protein n=1 Tax=Chitinophaga niabensis TaxID=536979 RepID=UPI0031BB1AE2